MHRYFDAKDWGFNWPEDPALANVTAAPPPPMDHGLEVAFAPWVVLFGFVLGVVLNANRRVGDTACAWRLSYSPASPAFGIWAVIYIWTIGSIVGQLAKGYTAPTYLAEPQTSYLMGLAWLLVGLWGLTFGRGADRDRPAYIALAAFVLAAASVVAMGAVVVEHSWRSMDAWRIVGVGVPYSLFAGWLCVATTLNIGIAVESASRPPDYRCERGPRRYSTLLRADPIDARAWSSWVPLLVSILLSAAAFVIADPVLVVPPFVAVWFMKGHFKNWVALEVLVVSGIAAIVEIATDRRVFRSWF